MAGAAPMSQHLGGMMETQGIDTAYARLKGPLLKIHGMEFAERVLWARRPEGPLGKLIRMRDDGSVLGGNGRPGCEATPRVASRQQHTQTQEVVAGGWRGRAGTRRRPRKQSRGRTNL